MQIRKPDPIITEFELLENRESKIEDSLLSKLKPFLTAYGANELAYSTLQRDMRYFFLEGVGYIAFKTIPGVFRDKHLVLSDPICSLNNQEELTKKFLQNFPNSTFWQTHKTYSKLLNNKFGFYANQFGIVTNLPVDTYDISGVEKQNLRNSIRSAEKAGVIIQEGKISEISDLSNLVDEYIATKTVSSGEMTFLARELVKNDEFDTRVFTASINSKLVGLAVCSPMYTNHQIIGYGPEILRTTPDAPKGLAYALTLYILNVMKSENDKNREIRQGLSKRKIKELAKSGENPPALFTKFTLGLSPYSHIHDDEFMNNPLTTLILVGTYQLGNDLYNCKGLSLMKRIYGGEEEPVYVCSNKKIIIPDLLTLYKACNINIWGQMAKKFSRTKD